MHNDEKKKKPLNDDNDIWGFNEEEKKLVDLQDRIITLLFSAEGEPFTAEEIVKRLNIRRNRAKMLKSEDDGTKLRVMVFELLGFMRKHRLLNAKDLNVDEFITTTVYWEKYWQDC